MAVTKEAKLLGYELIRKSLVFFGKCEILFAMSSGPFAGTREAFQAFCNRNENV
jgi:hypothetical protein